MKKFIFILSLLLLSLFIMPVGADEGFVAYDYPTISPPALVVPTDIPIYEPWNDTNMAWFTVDGLFDPVMFLKSSVSPYTDILGAYFYLILYTCFCILVYFRSRGLELLVVSIGVTFGVWVVWMPPDTVYLFLVCVAIGITALFFRLFNKR